MAGFALPERYASFLRLLSDTKEFSVQMPTYTKRDGAAIIYAFNSLFDISWKLMKDSLFEFYGLDDVKPSPRDVIKRAAAVELIENETEWLSMLKNRNLSTHDYMSTNHQYYCEQIAAEYLPLMEQFKEQIRLQVNELASENESSSLPGIFSDAEPNGKGWPRGYFDLAGSAPDFPDIPDPAPEPFNL